MEETVKQRLVKYLRFKGLGQNKFEAMAGIGNGYISNLKKAPGIGHLTKILKAAPDLNEKWLTEGIGEMLKTSEAIIKTDLTHTRIPLDVISLALGHSFGNKVTQIYVEWSRGKVDEANRKVIDHINEEGRTD